MSSGLRLELFLLVLNLFFIKILVRLGCEAINSLESSL